MGMTLIHRTRRENDCPAQNADTWAWLLWTYREFCWGCSGNNSSCYGWARGGLEPREALQLYTELAHFRTSTNTQPISLHHMHSPWVKHLLCTPMHRDLHRHACCLQPTQANQTHKTGGMHEVDWCEHRAGRWSFRWFPGLEKPPYPVWYLLHLLADDWNSTTRESFLWFRMSSPWKKCRHHKEGKHFYTWSALGA